MRANYRSGDRVIVSTAELWFPGGVTHECEVVRVGDGGLIVRGEKRLLGLWKVHKEFAIPWFNVLGPIQSPQEQEINAVLSQMEKQF